MQRLIRQGIDKDGLKHPEDARLRLGMARDRAPATTALAFQNKLISKLGPPFHGLFHLGASRAGFGTELQRIGASTIRASV